ncbi:Uncharacterised protein [Staphylococcus aureus]|nr:Uncharacterised protein [Staphylococcus aureus]
MVISQTKISAKPVTNFLTLPIYMQIKNEHKIL